MLNIWILAITTHDITHMIVYNQKAKKQPEKLPPPEAQN
jgi:hypothetical protein